MCFVFRVPEYMLIYGTQSACSFLAKIRKTGKKVGHDSLSPLLAQPSATIHFGFMN